jgi:hypothetical protein
LLEIDLALNHFEGASFLKPSRAIHSNRHNDMKSAVLGGNFRSFGADDEISNQSFTRTLAPGKRRVAARAKDVLLKTCCRANLPRELAARTCRANLPRELAARACRASLPRELASFAMSLSAAACMSLPTSSPTPRTPQTLQVRLPCTCLGVYLPKEDGLWMTL